MITKLKTLAYKSLRWSEKYAKTDMVYLAKGGFWLNVVQIISLLSSFVLSVVFANLIPQSAYGDYKYIQSVVAILMIFSLNGMGTAVIQSVAKGYESSLIVAMRAKIKYGLIGSVIGLGIATYYFFTGNNVYAICFIISSAFIPFMDSFLLSNAFLVGKERFKEYSDNSNISQVVATLAMVAVIFLYKNIYIIIFTYFASWTLIRYLFYLKTINKFHPHAPAEKDSEVIRYGTHLSLNGAIGTIAVYIDKLVVFYLLGPIELAIYSVAMAAPEQIRGFFKNITTLVLPKLSRQDNSMAKSKLTTAMLKSLPLIIVIIALYIFVSPFLFKLLFPKYYSFVGYSQLSSLIILGSLSYFLNPVFYANKAAREIYISNTITSVFQIVVTIALGYLFNTTGVIVAKILSQLFTVIIIYLYMDAAVKKGNDDRNQAIA